MNQTIAWLVLCLPLFAGAQAGNNGIHFEQGVSWQQVKEKARAENKYIFMDVFATWCGPCRLMDKEVYPDSTVGRYVNEKFISVKVQMDSTLKDNQQVKEWYADAHDIRNKYAIPGYPSFLFFTPDAKLAYRDLGYKSVPDFVRMANKALSPQNVLYFGRLEAYKKGDKNYDEMGVLARYASDMGEQTLAREIAVDYLGHQGSGRRLTQENILLVRDVVGNRKLADSLARAYKSSYLDKLDGEKLCTRENLLFIDKFNYLIHTGDNIFQLCYEQPEKVNETMEFPDWARTQVESAVGREELAARLWREGKPVTEDPDWKGMTADIQRKYGKVNAGQLVLNYQIAFYRKLQNWVQWAKYEGEKIKTYNLKEGDGFWKLNLPAWDAFLYCNDKAILQIVLEWSDLSIKIDEPNPNVQCLDTRANLLYKLGRVKEAIAQEEKAIEWSRAQAEKAGRLKGPFIDLLMETLTKMRKGEPTYVNEGAVWNAGTLPRAGG